MSTRYTVIEQILRLIYGTQPNDDSSITFNLVNQWLNQAIGLAIKKNYTDNIQLDGVAYINNAFYTSFSDISITAVPNNNNSALYQLELPQIPIALGKNEGIATLQFVSAEDKKTSHTAIPLSMNQVGYIDSIRPIQNKIVYWNEGKYCFIKSTLLLSKYKAKVRMVSGGDANDLDSTLIIPDDYMPTIIEYVKAQLAFEESRVIDTANDGNDH